MSSSTYNYFSYEKPGFQRRLQAPSQDPDVLYAALLEGIHGIRQASYDAVEDLDEYDFAEFLCGADVRDEDPCDGVSREVHGDAVYRYLFGVEQVDSQQVVEEVSPVVENYEALSCVDGKAQLSVVEPVRCGVEDRSVGDVFVQGEFPSSLGECLVGGIPGTDVDLVARKDRWSGDDYREPDYGYCYLALFEEQYHDSLRNELGSFPRFVDVMSLTHLGSRLKDAYDRVWVTERGEQMGFRPSSVLHFSVVACDGCTLREYLTTASLQDLERASRVGTSGLSGMIACCFPTLGDPWKDHALRYCHGKSLLLDEEPNERQFGYRYLTLFQPQYRQVLSRELGKFPWFSEVMDEKYREYCWVDALDRVWVVEDGKSMGFAPAMVLLLSQDVGKGVVLREFMCDADLPDLNGWSFMK